MIFYPKLLTTLKEGYTREKFFADLTAGVIVGIVALPLAIAFAIASGVTPDRGLTTAIIAGFLISALGGSRVQVGGPTGAFVVILYGIVNRYGPESLAPVCILAGLMLIVMGVFQLGAMIKYVPYPLVVGFTSGIAVIIFSSQMKDFFGLQVAKVPGDFVEKWRVYADHFGTFNLWAFLIAAGTVAIVALAPKISKRVPGSIIAVLFFSILTALFKLPVETIASRFGELPSHLPSPAFPAISFQTFQHLFKPAFTVAMLGAMESLLCAVVADSMMGSQHRPNTELIAQGIANITCGIFGGIPATGAIARTATNVRNGAQTPVAGMIHAVTLLLILLFFGKYAGRIPMACLAGILVVVSYHMSEWHSFTGLLRGPKSDIAVLLITFFLTVFIDLTAAIEIGMVISAFLFMHRMASATQISALHRERKKEGPPQDTALEIPPGVEVYDIDGPLFFGAASHFEEMMRIVNSTPRVRILRMRNVPMMDATGINTLKRFHQKCLKQGTRLMISGLRAQPVRALKGSGFYETLGEESFFADFKDALRASVPDPDAMKDGKVS